MTRKRTSNTYQLKIILKNTSPPIWRRILVPSDIKLDQFSAVLQVAMGWDGGHMHSFDSGGIEYGDPGFGGDSDDLYLENECKKRLSQLLTNPKDKLTYTYDFGDNWQHTVLLEKIIAVDSAMTHAVCVSGKRACPPDDCGGVWGYQELIEIMADPDHPEYETMKEWLGDDLDPEEFDVGSINEVFSRIGA